MNENKKARIWVYAIILFTSAFVILLLTAYSQIKLNRNLSNYKNQITSQMTEKKKVQQNFSSAQEMNVKLNDQIKNLQEENKTLQESISGLESEKSEMEQEYKVKSSAVDGLNNAVGLYLNGKVIECAGMIDGIDTANLDSKSLETYKTLAAKAKAEAGKGLFEEGFTLYNRGKYTEAADKLLLSIQFAPKETYSDKCLFYLAYSEGKLEDKTAAVAHMEKLVSDYPESRYLRSAKRFIERYK